MKRGQVFGLLQALRFRDRILVSFFVIVGCGALLFWFGAIYMASTQVVPETGGEYIEGIASQPRYINPILSQTSEADADLSELIYSGLFSYDASGGLVNRLAEDYTVSEDGKMYTVNLRHGVKWHDGQEVTADDVLFTVQAIQDPAYKSPLRANWLAVDAAAMDQYTLTFTLKKPYFGFLQNLTVGILPKHIWETITPENFLLADYNLTPVGSGPYKFFDSEKDSSGNMLSYELRAFDQYFSGSPYMTKIVFRFYPDEASVIDAYNRKEVLGINTVMPQSLEQLKERKSTRVYEIAIPRIFSVFFNQTKSAALAHDEIRQALALSIDRQAIIDDVLLGKGQPAYSAFLPFMTGYSSDFAQPGLDREKANRLLDEKGWKRGEDDVRIKDGTILEFDLMVPDWPELTRSAEILKTQWAEIGVRVTVTVLGAADLQQNVIRPREYEALLFGEEAMLDSDPYSFWHSSQKHDPGLNLALFDDKDADDTLLALREEIDDEKRLEQYRRFQEILTNEIPALFLYSPKYLYVVNSLVKGVNLENANEPGYRLSGIKDWYIDTKRIRK